MQTEWLCAHVGASASALGGRLVELPVPVVVVCSVGVAGR